MWLTKVSLGLVAKVVSGLVLAGIISYCGYKIHQGIVAPYKAEIKTLKQEYESEVAKNNKLQRDYIKIQANLADREKRLEVMRRESLEFVEQYEALKREHEDINEWANTAAPVLPIDSLRNKSKAINKRFKTP